MTMVGVPMTNVRRVLPLLALVAHVTVTVVADVALNCPAACRCAWQSGHRAALCAAANFTSVPETLDAEVQILDLARNHIASLHKKEFVHTGVVNLQRLNLSTCHVQTIHGDAFHSLDLLVSLDLSYNELTAIVPLWFESTPRLRHLRLDGNRFTTLEDRLFAPLTHLRALLLNDCHTSDTKRGAFTGLESSLQHLELNRNKLRELDVAIVAPLRALGSLELADNPWKCTCALKLLRDWMNKQYIVSPVSPVCASPERHASRTWDALDDDNCGADAIGVGYPGDEDVSLVCELRGADAGRLRWMHEGQPLSSTTGGTDHVALHTNAQTHTLTIKSTLLRDANLTLNLALQYDTTNTGTPDIP